VISAVKIRRAVNEEESGFGHDKTPEKIDNKRIIKEEAV